MASQSAIPWQKLEYFSLMVSATAIAAGAGTDRSALASVERSRGPGRKLCWDKSQTAKHRAQAGPSRGFQRLGQQQTLQIAFVGSSEGVTPGNAPIHPGFRATLEKGKFCRRETETEGNWWGCGAPVGRGGGKSSLSTRDTRGQGRAVLSRDFPFPCCSLPPEGAVLP